MVPVASVPARRVVVRRIGRSRVRHVGRVAFAGKAAQAGDVFPGTVGGVAGKTATPWGPADLVEELTLPQQAGARRFTSRVQLLETERGERLVRFAYSTGGSVRRGPVTLRERDVARLRAALAERPTLAQVLGW